MQVRAEASSLDYAERSRECALAKSPACFAIARYDLTLLSEYHSVFRACLQVKFLAKRAQLKIMALVTCKAYLAATANREPEYSQHCEVITDGNSGTPKQ